MKKFIVILVSLFLVGSVYSEKVRVFKNPDGSIGVFYPAPNSKKATETDSEWFERVAADSNIYNLTYSDIDTSDLPSDRKDRHAWEYDENSKKVKVNEAKKAIKDAEKAAKQEVKDGGRNKLKALGLTDNEINVLMQ